MASIAYVSDHDMIEFHRLNGSHTINFWRPSTSKKIAHLNQGDLLFFLAKGSEQARSREKGLVGYGKLKKISVLSFKHMWAKYGIKNGYHSKEALQQAICKITKTHEIPNQLSCFELEEIVFFQYPIYLSEIGMQISNHVESFIYIDKDNMYNTNKILKIAKSFGEDLWAQMMQDKTQHDIDFDAKLQIIQNISNKLKVSYYTSYDIMNIQKYISEYEKQYLGVRRIGSSKTEFIQVETNKLKIYMPCIVNSQDFDKKIQYVIGHYILYKSYLIESGYNNDIETVILFNKDIDKIWIDHLERLNIQYKKAILEE